jgi:hypothetical protein
MLAIISGTSICVRLSHLRLDFSIGTFQSNIVIGADNTENVAVRWKLRPEFRLARSIAAGAVESEHRTYRSHTTHEPYSRNHAAINGRTG